MRHRPSTKSHKSSAAELPDAVLVRRGTPVDDARIRVLARLEDRRAPRGPHLVAVLNGEVLAAISLASREVVADPFQRTADAADLLRLRAGQLADRERDAGARAGRRALRPAAA